MIKKMEVGNTPLVRIDIDDSLCPVKTAWVKDESKNPFGTIKDRRSVKILREASRLRVDKLVLITSGNNGYSLSKFFDKSNNNYSKIVCVVSRDISISTKNSLERLCYQLIELNLDHKILRPEELASFAREKEDEVIWDVTNGFEESYSGMIDEIFEEVIPDYIIVPVGSGGIFMGVVEAIENKNEKTKVIGVGVQNTLHSFADKLSTPWSPYSKALDYYKDSGHFIYRLSESELKQVHDRFKNVIETEPSSSIVFSAINKHSFCPSDNIVFINSGKGGVII